MIQPLKWHGGKGRLATKIIDHIPAHTRYLEPYAGGLSVLLRKSGEGVAEWVNDLNGDLSNFWQIIGDPFSFERFQRLAESCPMSEGVFDSARRSIDGSTGVARAFWFFVKMRQSRQGIGKDYATPTKRLRRGMNEQVSSWLSAVEGLPEIHNRIKRVEIWNRPAIESIKKLDDPDLFVYADPPYLHSTRNSTGEYGSLEMSSDDHAELLEALGKLRGRFLLSGYRSTVYDAWASFYNFRRVDIETPNNASSAKTKERKVECLWMNY